MVDVASQSAWGRTQVHIDVTASDPGERLCMFDWALCFTLHLTRTYQTIHTSSCDSDNRNFMWQHPTTRSPPHAVVDVETGEHPRPVKAHSPMAIFFESTNSTVPRHPPCHDMACAGRHTNLVHRCRASRHPVCFKYVLGHGASSSGRRYQSPHVQTAGMYRPGGRTYEFGDTTRYLGTRARAYWPSGSAFLDSQLPV